jgi:preprotein translocase subunit SecY
VVDRAASVAPIPFIGDWLDRRCRSSSPRRHERAVLLRRTSLLIVVGVTMDTVRVESQLIMRHYDGFMKKTRLRGRRG